MVRDSLLRRLGPIAGLSLLLAAGATADQPAAVKSFSSEAAAVTVDVLVLDGDERPVRGLTPNDFVLLEDDRPQTIVGFKTRDIDTATVDSLKVLDPKRPIREADIGRRGNASGK